ncbi:MAG: DNA mismatch repair endonuclease MutL, partial [Eubacterium sp.]|nr:DNA mismatch repair endonuclease MutL [Eubacterium sp.]
MHVINILDETTIDQIAAGEVVDRPLNVVKELCENSIDSGATAITVEIKNGGCSFIRVTDNGMGIPKEEVRKAFLRHATSKITDFNDLTSIKSLGFRGEALSSICAVSSVELITKVKSDLLGTRYLIEGSKELSFEDIGAPDGTTIIVRDLFYNVPARKKFLKSDQTEGSHVAGMMEHLALSHPEISVEFINNGKSIFQTPGNNNSMDVIYRIFGRDVKERLLPLSFDSEFISIRGYIGKPEMFRANRNYENIFVNGRFVECEIISKAVEEG